MYRAIVDQPYRFIPSRPSRLWDALIRPFLPRLLRRGYGVGSGECVGVEHLRGSLDAGHGVLLAANHCRLCDPLVLGRYLAPAAGTRFHTMASAHLFLQSRLLSFLLPRVGVFSVYREGLDRESLQHAIGILGEARRPLVVFPEGFVTRSNDRLGQLMDGVAFMARLGAKQAEASGPDRRTVIHPVFIRYHFRGEVEATVARLLEELESRISWQPQRHLGLRERVRKLGDALLALKELEHLGHSRSGPVAERVAALMEHLLHSLEARWLASASAGTGGWDPMERVKRLRTVMLPELVHGKLAGPERDERWRQLDLLDLVQRLHGYPENYLADSDAPDRLLETVECFEEDLCGQPRPHGPLHAVITVGEAIEVSPGRSRGVATDSVMAELRMRMEGLMQRSRNPAAAAAA